MAHTRIKRFVYDNVLLREKRKYFYSKFPGTKDVFNVQLMNESVKVFSVKVFQWDDSLTHWTIQPRILWFIKCYTIEIGNDFTTCEFITSILKI